MARLAMAVAAVSIVVGLRAQSTDVPRPQFEVASIKQCASEPAPAPARNGGRSGDSSGLYDPVMFRAGCVPVRFLIQMAYVHYANRQTAPVSQLMNQPIQGGPEWIDSDRYSIEAKPAVPQTRSTMAGPMLQSLLEDRFKLKIHRESKRIPVYALVVAKGGPKLQVTHEGGCTHGDPQAPPPPVVPGQPLPCGYIDEDANGIHAVGVAVASLCQLISAQVHRSVIDQTGLSGLFEYHLDFHVPPPGVGSATDDRSAPDSFATAIASLAKLGLRLESTQGDAEFLVIDHIERPTGN